jgi:ABC-type Fe3+-hydroxamate transport system substrate-binding protein
MLRHAVTCLMVVFVLTLVAGYTQAADKTQDGLIVSVAEGKLVMTDAQGKNEQTHAIGPTAKISLNGKEAKLADLKKGDKVKVTASEDGKVTAVAATRA